MRPGVALVTFAVLGISTVLQPPLAGQGLPGQEGTAPVESADFLTWARERAIKLDSLKPGEVDPDAFAFLDRALEGKRVVYLGETDHFVAERMEFRLLWIRELARRGFRRIGMEMGLSDGKRMDRYLATGDHAWLRRVALYGYRGDLRADRKDEVPGWTDDSHPEFTKTIVDEAQWFLGQLREINEGLPDGEPRLRWFGYDLSFRPGGGYADANGLLAAHDGDPLVVEIRARMARVTGESRLAEAERIEALVARLDERRDRLVALLGEPNTIDLRRSLLRMADAFRFIDAMQDLEDFDAKAVAAALAAREVRMNHNIDEHLVEGEPGEKMILLGHALHLSKRSTGIRTRDFGAMWETIGMHVARAHPDQVYAIWLLHHRGHHGHARSIPPVQRFTSPRGSVERLLTQIHPILMLPLGSGDPREAWLEAERVFSHGGAPAYARLSRQVDCLFFVKVAHRPGVRWGEPR